MAGRASEVPRKDEWMQIRISAELKELLRAAAALDELDLSSWVRMVLGREAKKRLAK
jgi:uncharacterized protein (DUF1778 family)